MSGPLLTAIIKLLALVAKEDGVQKQERDQIESFLIDNLNPKSIPGYMKEFDDFVKKLSKGSDINRDDIKQLTALCDQINTELTFQQKVVVVVELVGVMVADGKITEREEILVESIGSAFNFDDDIIEKITAFTSARSIEDIASEHVAIANGNKDETFPHHIYRHDFDGFMAFLQITGESECYFTKYVGNTNVFLSGIPIKPNKVKMFAPGSSIRQDGSNPLYYGDVISHFVDSEEIDSIVFEARNIDFRFKNGKLGLRQINLSEKSGNLVGIMGSSGAGKSTLCNVLNGMEAPSDGQILINGIDINKNPDQVEGLIGFVPQDDLLMEELTCYDNLYYAAKLCFSHLGKDELDKLVIKTMSSLGILQIKDLKVGSPLSKTISGGQRKRLNVGLELLREPSVLFVDEPTSGLSSRDAESIMDLMKELTLKGKLIFVVIHQPSSDIFKMFDKLIILDVGGYQIYNGNPVEAVVYFKQMIDMINADHGECIECGNVNPEQIFNIIETKVVNEYGNLTDERKIAPEQWNAMFLEENERPQWMSGEDEPPESSLKTPGRFNQMGVFIQRDVLSKLSNTQYLVINLLEAPLLAFILAFLLRYSEAGGEYWFGKNINVPAYLFMSVIVALFMGLTVSAEEIIKDRKILKREAFLNLSRSSYLMSKILILFTISAIQTLLFVLIGNSILEMKGMLLANWGILFATSCLANIVGLNISSSFNSAVTIYILIPILIIPQLILSGVVVHFDKLNPTISSYSHVPLIGDIMASRWAFEASMVTQYKDNAYEKQFYDLDKQMGQASYMKTYYIPTLESKLEIVQDAGSTDEEKNSSFEILRNEIGIQLRTVGKQFFPEVDQLNPMDFTQETGEKASAFLDALRKVQNNRFNKANNEKNTMLAQLNSSGERQAKFLELQNRHRNESIEDILTGKNRLIRIQEVNGRLVQQSNLIFKEPNPASAFDLRQQFYTPGKNFFGVVMDTYWYNLIVIWLFSVVFTVTLYFDLLRKIVSAMGGIKFGGK